MKVSRWIYIPLFFGLCFGFLSVISNNESSLNRFLFGFISGALMGLILQIWSYFRTKGISRMDNQSNFSTNQRRNLVVLLSFDKTFELCCESVESVKSAHIKSKNFVNGFIEAKTKMNFYSFGTEIIFNLKAVSESLTEIEVLARPVVKLTLVDYGQSLNTIEKIVIFLKEKDAEINQKVLVESASILDNVYVKPFQKEKVER